MDASEFVTRVSRTGGREATRGVIPGRFALSVGFPDLPSPPGWKWTALSDVAQLESGHTPSRRHPEYWDGGVPWIGIKDAVDNHGRTLDDTYQTVSDLGLANSSARLLPARTVCLSRTASVGYVVVMGRPMATSQDFVNWVCGPELEADYLKYVLLAENDSLLQFASGTTHQTIYYPEAKAFHALLPPVDEQRAILRVLNALDEKIELNRRMNETLEAMARTLFKSWFIDFDPVRAKVARRPPAGMDEATAALFPASLNGNAPAEWREGSLASAVALGGGDIQTGPFGSQLHASDYVDHGIPVVMPTNIRNRRVVRTRIACVSSAEAERLARHRLRVGDLVYSRRGDVEKHAIVGPEEAGWLCGTGCLLVRPAADGRSGLSTHFLSLWLDHPSSRAWIAARAVGATMPNLNTTILGEVPVLVPSNEVLDAFDRLVAPLDDRARLARAETDCLVALRDSMLPRLLSGESRVRDAEREIGHVA
jgi:type I restriction enzyme S subunit